MDIKSKRVNKFLKDSGVYESLFDDIRIIDAEKGSVLELSEADLLIDTEVYCTDKLGHQERCTNCTTLRAFNSNEVIFKLEPVGGSIFMVFCLPIELMGKKVVIEMFKDVSKSMSPDPEILKTPNPISNIIEDLNGYSVVDLTTNLYNRYYIEEKLPGNIYRARKMGTSLSIAMLDIDNMRGLKVKYGKQSEDTILKSIGEIISSFIRGGSDWAATYSSGRFFICFSGIEKEDIKSTVSRLKKRIEEHIISYENKRIRTTVCIGLTCLTNADNKSSLLNRCYKLLCKAKKSGRNKLEFK